ncbi:MAG: FAD-dependent monooxygenase [Vicinamibacterales bacterium]
MKILVCGGGPAGLYFSILMKARDAGHAITVCERDGADDTFGWGIVFSDQTFGYLEESDAPSYRAITSACQLWDNVDVVHRGEAVTIRGNRFSGIGRLAFLKCLHQRCRELGVDVRFNTPAPDPSAHADYDLVVGADGARSAVRATYGAAFRPSLEQLRNKYIWLGTSKLFNGLTLIFRQSEVGVFIAHAYKFSPDRSTFIVECSPEAWSAAGLDAMSGDQACRYLEAVFADDLQGASLLTNNFVKWMNFLLVKNRDWHHRQVVLLGDALHTAHFSIGSGTKLALEDAIALARAIDERPSVDDALLRFEETRRPGVDRLQSAAEESLSFFEQAGDYMDLDPVTFAYRLMLRSGRIDHEKLKRRDPAFVARYEALQVGTA